MWQNKTRLNKTAKVPYAYTPSEDDPLVLVPDPEMVRWVEDAMDSLDQGHSSCRVAAWLVEKTNQKISHQGIINIWERHRGKGTTKPSKRIKQLAEKRQQTAPGIQAANQMIFKGLSGLVVVFYMTDDELVKLVWEVMVLKRRFEDDPYSLSIEQIELLKDHETQMFERHFARYKGLLAIDTFS